MSIADGNLHTPLPKIHSEDELLQLRNAFEYMQTSLKQHINELQATTASKERLQSELIIAHDIQMGMLTTVFPERDDLTLLFLRHGASRKNNSAAPRRIIMKNEMSEVSRMRGFFLSVCREHNIDDDTFKTLNLAIEEWVANVIGGLGIHLVKAIMDTMHYERTADGYNVLTLTKELKIED